ncbi:MAG: type VI secretion system tube protein Hcp [Phycisphaerales bacterium]
MQVVLDRKVLLVLVVAAGAAVGAWALAGDLNPPAGPVAPTMKTLDEVFTAASATGGGSNANCIPGMHGTLGLFGTCAIAGLPANMPNPTFEVINFTQAMSKSPPPPGGGGGGGVSGPTIIGDFVLTKPLDRTSVGLYRGMSQGTVFSAATVTLLDAASTPTMTIALKNCRIIGRDVGMVYRCDGSTVMTERIAINSRLVRYTDAVSGQFWEYNVETQVGSGN